MFNSSNPKLPFYVANHQELDVLDQQVLLKLYQPIIGALATSIYLTLNAQIDQVPIRSDFSRLSYLQEQLDVDLKTLFEALHRLEATVLIKTFTNSNEIIGESLIFEIQPVISPKEFFETFLLSSLLLEKVGEVSFNKLQQKFIPNKFIGLKDATEVSAGFFDVFHLNEDTIINAPKAVVDAAAKFEQEPVEIKKTVKEVVYQQQVQNGRIVIDWNYLHDLLASYHIPAGQIDANQKQISDLINFYQLNEQEFVRLAAITFSPGDATLNIKRIQGVLAQNNQNSAKVAVGNDSTTNQNSNTNTANLSVTDQKVLKAAQEYPPVKFLEMIKLKKGGYVTSAERQVVYDLQSKLGLKDDLINILVKTSLDSTATLARQLVDRIANDWLQHHVTTAEQALIYVNERQNGKLNKQKNYNKSYNYNNRPQKKEIATDWSEKKPTKKPKISDAELQKLIDGLDGDND